MAGFFARMFRRQPEQRLSTIGWGIGSGLYGHGGPSPHLAESLSAVLACVELISGSISSLPASLTIDTPEGRAPAPPTAAAWRILTRPNDWQSWPAFMQWAAASILLRGNAVSRIDADARGAVQGLTPIPWPWLSPQVITGAAGARLVYDVVSSTSEARLLNLPQRLLDSDVLHVRSRSDNGIIGRSVLSRAAAPIREALEIQTLAEANWRNGMRPSSLLIAPQYLNDPQRKRKQEWIEEYSGAINAGRVPLLEGGWKLEKFALSSVDAEFLATRQHSVGEICRMFNVPEHLLMPGNRAIADLAPFITAFAQLALAPIVGAIEAEFDHSVLPAGMHLAIDLAGLMRGSFSASTSALAALVQSGIITPNDARESLGWSPHPDGNALARGNAPSWPADGTGMPSPSPKPGPTGDMPPEPGTNQNQGSGGRGNGRMPAGMMN